MDSSTLIPLLMAGLLIAIVVFAIVSERRLKDSLRKRGKTVQGKIVGREWKDETRTDSDNNIVTSTSYTIRYEYVVDGSAYLRTLNASYKQYNNVAENEIVEVVYLPENPTKAMLAKFM
jgi:hypothetical protein